MKLSFGLLHRKGSACSRLAALVACTLIGWPPCGADDDSVGIAASSGVGAAPGGSAPAAPAAPPDFRTPVSPPSSPAQRAFDGALAQPALPGAPGFEAVRGRLLMRAKGEPTFFVRTPEPEPTTNEVVNHYRSRLASTRYPWDVLEQLLPRFRARPDLGRSVLLRDGYLYAEDPELAFALVSQISAEDLFDDARIWIQRGDRLMRARRQRGRYVYVDGRFEGLPVKLLMFDRLGTGDVPHSPALHRDFRTLAYRLGFDRARILHVTERHLVVELRYAGKLWVPTLLRSDGPHLELAVELGGPKLEAVRAGALARRRAVQALRHAMLLQVQERLPFDEPRHEVGQEDGKLRRSFSYVYREGRDSYRVRADRYPVFDIRGRPLAPQVCIDFLLDTIERASGTWWRNQGEVREVKRGRWSFADFVPRDRLRRAKSFINFAKSHPDLFEAEEIPRKARAMQGDKPRFFGYLAQHADLFQPGDIALIRGPTPWDRRREHYHSFFIYETDPVSGVPIAIAGNAGAPAIWSWESEARRTPERTLRVRIRPSLGLLERVAGPAPRLAPEPPPLVSRQGSSVS